MDPRNKTIDPLLTELATGYRPQEYAASFLFPVFKTGTQGGVYYKFNRSHRSPVDTARARGSKTNEIPAMEWTRATFYADDHALKQLVDDEEVKQAAGTYDPMQQATTNVTDRIYVGKEVEAAALVNSQVTQSTTLSGTSKWSDYDDSNPIADVKTGISTIENSISVRPNLLVIPRASYDALMLNQEIIERIKYSALGTPTDQILRSLFEVDRIVIAKSSYNTAAPGATPAFSDVWGDTVTLAYVSPNTAQKDLTFGHTMQYGDHQVDTWYEKDEKGTYVRDSWYYEQVPVAVEAAYTIKDTI